jgi:hypothetical protein
MNYPKSNMKVAIMRRGETSINRHIWKERTCLLPSLSALSTSAPSLGHPLQHYVGKACAHTDCVVPYILIAAALSRVRCYVTCLLLWK